MSNLLLRNISLLKGNYYSPQHQEHVSDSTLTTTLISYNDSKRRINFYPPNECMATHRLKSTTINNIENMITYYQIYYFSYFLTYFHINIFYSNLLLLKRKSNRHIILWYKLHWIIFHQKLPFIYIKKFILNSCHLQLFKLIILFTHTLFKTIKAFQKLAKHII